MNNHYPPLDARRQLQALLDRLHAAERAVDPAHRYAAQMIDFEQQQLLAEMERLTTACEANSTAAAPAEVNAEPSSLRSSLSAMFEGFVNALRTRTA